MQEVKPYAIINCAAHTNVNKCETDVDNAYKINAIGPRNLSIAAARTGAKLMHVSTDYVFDGNGSKPYIEFDPVDPVGMYGATKLAGETFVREFAKDWFIIRTAWLYGDGNNFVKTMLAPFGTKRYGACGSGSVRNAYQRVGAGKSHQGADFYG